MDFSSSVSLVDQSPLWPTYLTDGSEASLALMFLLDNELKLHITNFTVSFESSGVGDMKFRENPLNAHFYYIIDSKTLNVKLIKGNIQESAFLLGSLGSREWLPRTL